MFARRMQTVIANPVKPLGQNVLHHTANKSQHWQFRDLTLAALVVAVPIPHVPAIITQQAPKRDRRAHHILGQVLSEPLSACGDLPLLQIRHQAMGILLPQGINLLLHFGCGDTRFQHRHQMILPPLVQLVVRKITDLSPAILKGHASRSRGRCGIRAKSFKRRYVSRKLVFLG